MNFLPEIHPPMPSGVSYRFLDGFFLRISLGTPSEYWGLVNEFFRKLMLRINPEIRLIDFPRKTLWFHRKILQQDSQKNFCEIFKLSFCRIPRKHSRKIFRRNSKSALRWNFGKIFRINFWRIPKRSSKEFAERSIGGSQAGKLGAFSKMILQETN